MFQDLTEKERKGKILNWVHKRKERAEVLSKAVEVCLRARDAADKAKSNTYKNLKSSEEAAMIHHIEKLIANA